ncbi:inositol monophosphatase family protein [Nocardioides jishulii]|uniref:inositol monophosphatase family protein n=1 Tax=Nocardioides jishulii TaxID=2575440 RepID=UPI001BAF54A9|nr:inositol monophosphatase family protein [Nocardioides jishulii]
MSPGQDPDAALARELVEGAARLAGSYFRQGVSARAKSNPTDLVTVADAEAEAYVVSQLAAHRPLDGVLGEEGAARAGTSGRSWVIDPVDGTYNFVRGAEWWCSALALVHGDDLLLGAVHDPAHGQTLVGGPGRGVRVTSSVGEEGAGAARLEPLGDRSLSQACAATYLHPPFFGTEVGDAWQRVVQRVGTYRLHGSGSLDLAAIAQGRLDLFLHHSVPAWDRLPGQALVEALGGTTRTVEAAGVEWFVAGVPTAVAEACERLADR